MVEQFAKLGKQVGLSSVYLSLRASRPSQLRITSVVLLRVDMERVRGFSRKTAKRLFQSSKVNARFD